MAATPADHSKEKNLQAKSVLDWRDVAARVLAETDPNKTVELANELIRALDADSRKRLDHVTIEEKASEQGAA